MLQQTQVDRVIPVYHAFLRRFPTFESLADAPAGEVIRAWAGMGYNRRALNLQRAAQAVVELHGGSAAHRRQGAAVAAGRRGVHGECAGLLRAGAAGGGRRHQRAPGAGAGLPLAVDAVGPPSGGDSGARPARGQGMGVEPGAYGPGRDGLHVSAADMPAVPRAFGVPGRGGLRGGGGARGCSRRGGRRTGPRRSGSRGRAGTSAVESWRTCGAWPRASHAGVDELGVAVRAWVLGRRRALAARVAGGTGAGRARRGARRGGLDAGQPAVATREASAVAGGHGCVYHSDTWPLGRVDPRR